MLSKGNPAERPDRGENVARHPHRAWYPGKKFEMKLNLKNINTSFTDNTQS